MPVRFCFEKMNHLHVCTWRHLVRCKVICRLILYRNHLLTTDQYQYMCLLWGGGKSTHLAGQEKTWVAASQIDHYDVFAWVKRSYAMTFKRLTNKISIFWVRLSNILKMVKILRKFILPLINFIWSEIAVLSLFETPYLLDFSTLFFFF